MTVPDLLSASAAGTISRLDGTGRPLTNSPTMGRRLARAGRPRELKSEGKPTRRRMAGLLAHPSVAKAEARKASRCYKARIEAGRHMVVPAGRGGALCGRG